MMKLRTMLITTALFCICLTTTAKTVAYWQLQDKPVANQADKGGTLKSKVNQAEMAGKLTADPKLTVSFSADVPGKVILSGQAGKIVNPNNQAALKSESKRSTSAVFTVPGNKLLELDTFTVEAFIKVKQLPRWGRVFGKKRGNNRYSWILSGNNNTGQLRARIDSNPDKAKDLTGFNQGIETSFKLPDDSWHHLAVTYDGLTQLFTIYVDYKVVAQQKTALPICYDNQPLFFFGGSFPGKSASLIDEIRISDTVLSPEEFLRVKQ